MNDGYIDCSSPYKDITYLFQLHESAEYLCSFEASIYRRDFLKKYITPGQDPWQSEVETSRLCQNQGETIIVPKNIVSPYTDATRRGQSRIKGVKSVS